MTIDNEQWMLEKVLEYIPGRHKRSYKDITMRCPICGDSRKDPNKMRCHYYIHTQIAHCFNCDMSMSGMQFLKHLSGQDYNELKRQYIREQFNDKTHKKPKQKKDNQSIADELKVAKSIISDSWKKPLTESAKNYLDKRMILDAPFIADTSFYTCFDKENREYILIPWQFKGVDVYYQINDYLKHYDRKYIFPYNHNKMIFGLDNVDRAFKYVICFEGVYDSLFVKNGIAIGGKALTNYQQTLLKTLFPQHKIVMALDNDKAGIDAALKKIDEDPSVAFFNWMSKYKNAKDINELVINTNRSDLFVDDAEIESLICGSLKAKLILKGFTL